MICFHKSLLILGTGIGPKKAQRDLELSGHTMTLSDSSNPSRSKDKRCRQTSKWFGAVSASFWSWSSYFPQTWQHEPMHSAKTKPGHITDQFFNWNCEKAIAPSWKPSINAAGRKTRHKNKTLINVKTVFQNPQKLASGKNMRCYIKFNCSSREEATPTFFLLLFPIYIIFKRQKIKKWQQSWKGHEQIKYCS